MKAAHRSLAAVFLCLSVILCLCLCACTDKPDAPSGTSAESAIESVTEIQKESESMTESATESEPISETESVIETEMKTEPVIETESASVPETVTESTSVSEIESETVTETDAPETDDPALNVYPTDGKPFDIGIFFEPDAAHTTAEHYDWIKAAHITYIDSVNWDPAITEEINLLQAELCAERGIRLSYYPRRFGVDLYAMSAQELTEYCRNLMEKNTAITDLHVIDEPANPWVYAPVLKTVGAAGMTPRLNFLPYWATHVFENYNGHVEDTVIAVGKENYPTLYFDHYPYGIRKGSTPDMFYNMDLFRKIGLKYDLPTGLYLQAFGDPTCRRPNSDEIRYQASAALAYGFQSLTYFTWWTTNPPENTHNYAIIAPDGSKTDLYDDVVAINAQITKTGPLLTHLEALEIYHTAGKETGIILRTRDELPLFPESDDRFGFVVSLMEDSTTGRDYIMLVNKNFKKSVTATVTVTDAISYLYDCTNGAYEPIDIESGSFEASFLPGGYLLLAVGQKDCIVTKQLDQGSNLAAGKAPATHAVYPGNDYYAYCVTDGIRDNSSATALGFHSAQNTGFVEIDLGRVTALNRVDIYPTGTLYNKGAAFPKAFTIDVSADGDTWRTVATSDGVDATRAVPVLTFETVEARYVRMNVTEGCAAGTGFEIAEIEIYHDDGSIPAPEAYPTSGPAYEEGSNIAAHPDVEVICSSAYQEGTYWRIDGINDGRIMDVAEPEGLYCGWSSNVFVNQQQEGATEWIGYDFATEISIKSVIAYPAQNSSATPQGFPLSYCIEVSDDGVNWREIWSIEDDPDAGEFMAHVITFEPVKTRFIRFRGTKLTAVGNEGQFGYMMQMSEIQVIAE